MAQSPARASSVREPTLEASAIPSAFDYRSPAATLTTAPVPTQEALALPSPTPLTCWRQPGQIESGSLHSAWLPLPMEYLVYLPPCYDQQPERRYPVLYLIHGKNYNNDQWDRLGANGVADRLIAAGELAPFLIVMPRDRNWNEPSDDHFGQVVLEELMPRIEKDYRTLPERQARAIGGLSRGASWAIHLGLSHWELFSAIGAHSLGVFWEDTSLLRTWLDAIPSESRPRLFLDSGKDDYLLWSTQWYKKILDEKGYAYEWHLYPGYHEEAYWHTHVEEYIRWYAGAWKTLK